MSRRALGRATLARQCLLERTAADPVTVVRDLVGLQAQNPLDPYLGLWSRVADFDPTALAGLLVSRRVVRMVVMRGTIHLLAAEDAAALRILTQPVLDAEIARHSEFAPQLVGVDVTSVIDWAGPRLAEPMTMGGLRAAIAAEFPELPAAALAYACRCRLPLVQVPPRGVWGRTGVVTVAELDAWLAGADARIRPAACTIDELILRYLRAFGPATVADATAWCRLTGMREVFDRLQGSLVAVRDEDGRELFDVPDGPRPPADVPAPVRFLPEYDNVLLSHADRRRFAPAVPLPPGGPVRGTVLVDGVVAAIWRTTRGKSHGSGRMFVEHGPLGPAELDELTQEAERVAAFWLDDPNPGAFDVRPLPDP